VLPKSELRSKVEEVSALLSGISLRPYRASVVGCFCFLGASPQAIGLRVFGAFACNSAQQSIFEDPGVALEGCDSAGAQSRMAGYLRYMRNLPTSA